MSDLNKIVDDLSTLTILEASELTKLLEEKFPIYSFEGRSRIVVFRK